MRWFAGSAVYAGLAFCTQPPSGAMFVAIVFGFIAGLFFARGLLKP